MEKIYNSAASQDIVGALARRNNLSVDSFADITETRVSVFEDLTNNIIHIVRAEFEGYEQGVNNLLKSERESISTRKVVAGDKVKCEKEIGQKNVTLREAITGTFLKIVGRNTWFWVLSILTCLFMGPWTFITWVLVRRRVIELTDMIGGVIKYFAGYARGVPSLDVIIMLVTGTLWTLFFWGVYISMYNKNKINEASSNWKRKEGLAVTCFVLFEIFLTGFSAYLANKASFTNKQLFNASSLSLILESFPLVAAWLLWHFLIYKNWIINIRVKAGKICGEIYLVEIREALNKAISRKLELEKVEAKLELAENVRKQNKVILNDKIVFFKTTNRGITTEATREKNAILDFGQKWLVTAVDELTLKGEQIRIREYEIAIKNVIKRVSERIDKRAKECCDLIEEYNEKSNRIIKVLNADYMTVSLTAKQLLPFILLLSGILFYGCASSTIFNQKLDSESMNLLVAVDLSDRFLQDTDSKFLPVTHDIALIETAFHAWEQDIISSYDQGTDVTLVDGSFSVIPVSMPHELRRDISALGFCIELSNLPIIKRWEYLPAYEDSVIEHSNLLYRAALKYKPSGADVWAFFRDLPLYLKTSKDSLTWRNKLILLTDGYPYIEDKLKKLRKSNGYSRDYLDETDMNLLRGNSNWEEVYVNKKMGFIPIGKTYENLDVLVIGINEPSNLQGSATEFSIIQRYWSDFFESMGIEHYRFVRLNTPASENIIHDFLKI